MKNHPSAGDRPSTRTRAENTTGLNDKVRTPETVVLNWRELRDGSKPFILMHAAQWGCTPDEAVKRLLEELSANQRAALHRKRITIEVNRELYEEVSELLKSPACSFLGDATIEQRIGGMANTWLHNVISSVPQGSGYRRASGIAVVRKGGSL